MELTKTADAPSANPLNALISMFYEPTRAFGMLQPRRFGWLPAILMVVTTTILMVWYFNAVDFVWLQEQMLASVPAPERDQAREFMTKGMLMGGALGGALLGIPVILAMTGLYFMFISKAMNKEVGFLDGFALSAWAAVPTLLALPLGAIQILLSSNGQVSFSELNPLSLNQIFFHYDMANPMTSLLDSVNVTMIWNMFLMVIGYEVWAKVTRSTAVKVVLIPYATIYGIWFAIAMSKAA